MEDRAEIAEEEYTTRHVTAFDPSPVPSSFVLTVLEGPDSGLRKPIDGLSPSRVFIGHAETCDVILSDRSVSRRHAGLEVDGKRVRLTDLDSKNGTFVNGLAVTDVYLTGGELVRVGGTSFRLEPAKETGAKLPAATRFGRVIGASTEMRRLYALCERLANSDVPVIIEGETGTGKEALAEALHEEGHRRGGPFVVFDCTAVPSNLLEAELFGHDRGAFTGAVTARRGVLQEAHKGTLLIDEIGDLDITLQPKLLRAIERREVRPIGGTKSIKVDVRVIAATRRDLDREVQAGRFRDDLFHRLAVARIELPPLRRRRGDIPVLVHHFCKQIGGDPRIIPPQLIGKWEDEKWPGNIRELRNTVARFLALGELATLTAQGLDSPPEDHPEIDEAADAQDLAEVLQQALELPLSEARNLVTEEFERRYTIHMLARHGGNVTHAARSAGVARRYFQVLKARTRK